jgi:hypothetical protein
MAFLIRNTYPQAADNVQIMQSFAKAIGAASAFHIDRGDIGTGASNGPGSTTITSANATDLATLLVLTKEIVAKTAAHAASTVAHKVVDATFVTAVSSVVDLTSAITALNAVKGFYNTHRASTTYHYTADATNATSSADATDQSSANTLANELKTDFTAHVTSGNVQNVPVLVAF